MPDDGPWLVIEFVRGKMVKEKLEEGYDERWVGRGGFHCVRRTDQGHFGFLSYGRAADEDGLRYCHGQRTVRETVGIAKLAISSDNMIYKLPITPQMNASHCPREGNLFDVSLYRTHPPT